MLTVQEISRQLAGPIAVYGTDGGAIATDIYLKNLGLRENVVCFLAPDPKHTAFCGKPVLPTAYLAEHPGLTVVTACLDFAEIAQNLLDNNWHNKLYYHASFWPFMDDDAPVRDPAFIEKHYGHDSAGLIEALLTLRFNPNISRIQPWGSVQNVFHAPAAYWHGKNSLPGTELTIIDAGAFDGDTLQSLFKVYGSQISRYHAFEPMPEHFTRLQKNAALYTGKTNVHCYKMALYNQNSELAFHKGVPKSSRLADQGEIPVQGFRLDDLDLEITGQACLKMDVEGLELEALAGAAEFIRTHRPYLALCVYHKTNDIYEIPAFVRSLAPGYRFRLTGGVHTVCHGVCAA